MSVLVCLELDAAGFAASAGIACTGVATVSAQKHMHVTVISVSKAAFHVNLSHHSLIKAVALSDRSSKYVVVHRSRDLVHSDGHQLFSLPDDNQ